MLCFVGLQLFAGTIKEEKGFQGTALSQLSCVGAGGANTVGPSEAVLVDDDDDVVEQPVGWPCLAYRHGHNGLLPLLSSSWQGATTQSVVSP